MAKSFRYPYTVGLHDTDAAGVIYAPNIIRMAMIAYEALLVDIGYGMPVLFRRRTMGLPLVHIEADFQKPLTAGEQIIIEARVAEPGSSSYRLNYRFLSVAGELCATAATVHVCVNPQTLRAMELPVEFRTALETYR